MGFKFNELVTEALSVERELRATDPGPAEFAVFHFRMPITGRYRLHGSRRD